jgi:hypothetical protein
MQSITNNSFSPPEQEVLECCNSLGQLLSNTTPSIRSAEMSLQTLSKSPHFIHTILSIPLLPAISPAICKLAATYTRTYLRNLLSEPNIPLALRTSEEILRFVGAHKLDLPLKQ